VAISGDVAIGGAAGDVVERLLAKAIRHGGNAITDLTWAAVERLGQAGLLNASQLFSHAQRDELADMFAGILGASEALGRALVRDFQQRTLRAHGDLVECVQIYTLHEVLEGDADPPIITPEKALAYFAALVPSLGTDPQRFGADMRRRAFTLAVVTDTELLGRVRDVIRNAIQSGKIPGLRLAVSEILDGAGVGRGGGYAELVIRTNVMDAYNTGADQERMDPAVIDTFPVWRYAGIADGRERHTAEDGNHHSFFGKYYPAAMAFAEVRDSIKLSPWNCRCTSIPISKWEWAKLYAAGARIADGYPDVVPMDLSKTASRAAVIRAVAPAAGTVA
jgi:hypothetical protein